MRLKRQLETTMVYKKKRWAFAIALFLLYATRIWFHGGFYVVSYIMGLYYIQVIMMYVTPKGLPDPEDEEEDEDGPVLPGFEGGRDEEKIDISGENRPLIRVLPEFKLWTYFCIATGIALFCTLIPFLDLPVFWPFLLFYFILVVISTISKQRKRMKKYNYSILDFFRKFAKGY